MKQTLKLFVLAALGLFATLTLHAQMTTSSLSGKITDAQGAVPGVAVVAVHTPSGTQYYALSNNDGRYTIQGMRPGGPYEVTVQLLGYKTVVFEDITLKLSETYTQDIVLEDAAEQLQEVVVVASTTKFGSEKTGASTNVSNREMMNLPNSNRSLAAITKLSPYANGMSFAGSDGRSTNFTVDGANFNNNFGLSSSLPGGGTPISLDAIEEIQLVVAPFDVRQSNFVGGGINAITKSGTNTFKGTVYGYYHNEKLRGNKIAGEDLGDRDAELIRTIGATLGGPIIKNKLFFFTNFEMNDQPGQAIRTNGIGKGITEAQLKAVQDKLVKDYGYNPGSYTDFPGGTQNMKILARIDWNISQSHKLALRFNHTKNLTWYAPNGNSCDDSFRNRGFNRASDQAQPFSNNMYSQQNNVTSFAAELNSRFGEKAANQLIATYSFINDQRGSNSDIFPHVDIMENGDLSSGNFKPATSFGYELFTYKNGVTNKVWNVTDNFTYYAGAHKITAGANFEHMFADNSYIRNGTGYYRFASVDDFLNGARPLSFALYYAYDNSPETAQITYNQLGVYVQDDWNFTDRFKLNYGVRFDTIMYDDSDLITNNAILAYKMGSNAVDTGHWPKTTVQVNPRIGFNWDVMGDKSLTVRGGTGMFQGRLPLVFFTNMPTNSGMILNQAVFSGRLSNGAVTYTDEVASALDKLVAGGKIMTDTDQIKNVLGLKRTISASEGNLTGTINGVDRNFKMPQVWKSSLAIDWNVPTEFPMTLTAEGIFNKTIHGVRLVDWNINDATVESGARFSGPDKRYNYNAIGNYKYGKSTAYVLTNTNKGYGWIANVTLRATPVRNLDLMVAYTHTVNKEISGMPGSNATSAYTGLYSVNGPNFATLQSSQYVVPDKVMANISYFLPFKVFGGNGLHLNLYYSGYSAGNYSYIYSNDMNGDGIAADMMYIPASKDELRFASDADKNAFWAFLEQDKYLSSHKGQYAEAYAAAAPWTHRFDARIAEDFAFKIGKTKHNFQLSVSIDNIGNMINSSWGVTRWSCYTTSNGTFTNPVLKLSAVEDGTPVFSMNKVGDSYPTQTWNKYYKNPSECWQLLFGLKYYFN